MHTLTCSTAKLIALSAVVLRLGGAVERITTVSVTGSDNAVPNLRAIKMVDRLRGWSTGERSLWVTLDGARTWRMALIGDPVTSTISSFAWGVLADGKAWAVVSDPFKDPPSEIVRISPDGRTEELALPCLPASNCFPKAADFDRTGEKGILFGLKPIGPERNQVVEFRTLDAAQHWTETKDSAWSCPWKDRP